MILSIMKNKYKIMSEGDNMLDDKERDLIIEKLLEQNNVLIQQMEKQNQEKNRIYEECLRTVSIGQKEVHENSTRASKNNMWTTLGVSISLCLLFFGMMCVYFLGDWNSCVSAESKSYSESESISNDNMSDLKDCTQQ